MDENLYLSWGNSYIQISEGKMTVKHKGSILMNGVIGGMQTDGAISDRIENYLLLYFQIIMGRNVNFILLHKPSGSKFRVEIMVKKDSVKDFLRFKDIMEHYGLFDNRSRMDSFYGKESNVQNEIREMKFQREIAKSDENNFYEELRKLPGYDSWGTKKEIKHLKSILNNNESVLAIASGIMEGNTWLIACTSKRIIFIDCGMVYGVKHSEVLIDKVNAISFRNGLVLGEIHIEDGASTRIIKNVQKYSTKPFVDAVHKAMEMKTSCGTFIQNIPSIADELLKYKQLLDMGVITSEEFENQKKKLLEK